MAEASAAAPVDWGSCRQAGCACGEGCFAGDHTSESICSRCPHPRYNHNAPVSVSPAGLSGWLRDLTREGVEANPGPCTVAGCPCTLSVEQGIVLGAFVAGACNTPGCGHAPGLHAAAAASVASTDSSATLHALRQFAELQLQRQSCTVLVRRWASGEAVRFRVATFAELRDRLMGSALLADPTAAEASASAAAALPATQPVWMLYYFPHGQTNWWRDRVKVDDEDSFADYVGVYANRLLQERPMLLVWMPPMDCTEDSHHADGAAKDPCDHSPLKNSAAPAEPLIPLPPPSVASSSSVRSGSSRSSTDQRAFAEAVYTRDGKQCVVSACEAKQVEAAHIVPVGEARSAEGKAAAGLLMLYEPRNGLCLCTTCHDYFDAGLWFIDPSGSRNTIVASSALTANDPDWAQRDGEAVRLPSSPALRDSWPSKRILQVQQAFFQQKKAERHSDVLERPYSCPSCLRRFVTNGDAFKLHKKSCTARAMPADFRTPVKARAHKKK